MRGQSVTLGSAISFVASNSASRKWLGLTYINALAGRRLKNHFMWQPISTAPFGSNLELAVIEREVPHALVFPCRRVLHGWVHAETKSPVHVDPTHWRPWSEPC
jgi:hypothetical protein